MRYEGMEFTGEGRETMTLLDTADNIPSDVFWLCDWVTVESQ